MLVVSKAAQSSRDAAVGRLGFRTLCRVPPDRPIRVRLEVAGLAASVTLTAGFLSLWAIWQTTRSRYDGLLGFPDFASGTYGDAVLLPCIIGCLAFLASGIRLPSRIALVAIGFTGLLVGCAVQVAWLSDDSEPRQWGIPERWEFSLPGWWHAIFFCLACSVVAAGTAAVILGKQRRKTGADQFAVLLLGAAAVAFGLLVIADSTRGEITFSNRITALSTVAATVCALVPVVFAVIERTRDRISNLGAVGLTGCVVAVLLESLHGADGDDRLAAVVYVLCFISGAGLALAHWRFDEVQEIILAPPAVLILMFATVAALVPATGAAVLDSLGANASTLTAVTSRELLALDAVALALWALSWQSTGWRLVADRILIDALFVFSLAGLASVLSIDYSSGLSFLAATGAAGIFLFFATQTIPPEVNRYTAIENEVARKYGPGSSSPSEYVYRLAPGLLATFGGIVLRGVSCLMIFLAGLVAIAVRSGVVDPRPESEWLTEIWLAVGTAIASGALLLLVGVVNPTSRSFMIAALVAPIAVAAVSVFCLIHGQVPLGKVSLVFLSIAAVQGIFLGLDAAQSQVGTGCWLRGRRFSGGDVGIAVIYGVGTAILMPIEFLLIYFGSGGFLPVLGTVASLGVLRAAVALGVGRLAESRGGQGFASMQTVPGFLWDEIIRWVIAVCAVGAPAVVLRAVEGAGVFAEPDSLPVLVASLLVVTGTSLVAMIVLTPAFATNNLNYFYSQRDSLFGGRHAAIGGPATDAWRFISRTPGLWRDANRESTDPESRVVAGLGAHIGVQNILRNIACAIHPVALLYFAMELVGNRMSASYPASGGK